MVLQVVLVPVSSSADIQHQSEAAAGSFSPLNVVFSDRWWIE
jgi:hypothetical protein